MSVCLLTLFISLLATIKLMSETSWVPTLQFWLQDWTILTSVCSVVWTWRSAYLLRDPACNLDALFLTTFTYVIYKITNRIKKKKKKKLFWDLWSSWNTSYKRQTVFAERKNKKLEQIFGGLLSTNQALAKRVQRIPIWAEFHLLVSFVFTKEKKRNLRKS